MEEITFTLDSVELDGIKFDVAPTPYPIKRFYRVISVNPPISSMEQIDATEVSYQDTNSVPARFTELTYYEVFGEDYASVNAFFARCESDGLRNATDGNLSGEYVGSYLYEYRVNGHYEEIYVVFYMDDECVEGECEHDKTDGKCRTVRAEGIDVETRTLWLYGLDN